MPSNRSLARLSCNCARSSADLALFIRGHRGDEIVLRLNVVGGLDHEQRLALATLIARPGQKFGDPAGIGREHRRRAIFIDRDLAFGDVFGAEAAFGNGLDGQARPFGGARRVALQSLAGLAGDFRMPPLVAAYMRRSRRRPRRQAPAAPPATPAFPAKCCNCFGKFVEHRARTTQRQFASPVR